MRILVYSDLHLEFESKHTHFAVPGGLDYDVVVLAGDIHMDTRGIIWAASAFVGKRVLYVSGNHEYYHTLYPTQNVKMAKVADQHNHLDLLANSSVVIAGVRFIGTTLWTDFKLFGDSSYHTAEAMHQARISMADFSLIRYRLDGAMTPTDASRLFTESVRFLETELAKPHDGKTVVITHHLPSFTSVTPKFRESILSAAFASNLDRLVSQADLWIHGHAHESMDYHLDNCRVICNPRGYPAGETVKRENPDFRSDLIVEI